MPGLTGVWRHWGQDDLAGYGAGRTTLPGADNGQEAAGVGGRRPLPLGLAEGPGQLRLQVLLISVGFWLTGVLSQSPHLNSQLNFRFSLHAQKGGASACSDVWAPGFIPLSFSVLCAPGHLGRRTRAP